MAFRGKRLRPGKHTRAPQVEELEPRLLFSADAVGLLAPDTFSPDQPATEILLDDNLEPILSAARPALAEDERLELVFVDTDTPDYHTLVMDLLTERNDGRSIEVIVLDNQRDGIDQISETLQLYQGVDAIHLISHGSDGNVELGNTSLDAEKLPLYEDQLKGWRDSLGVDADILFYGCNLAATEAGRSLITEVGTLTLTDVAASDDVTGHHSLGGDWELEFQRGELETEIAVGEVAQRQWIEALDITSGLQTHLTFDAGQGAQDSSGNNFDGILSDNAAVDTTPATNQVGDGKLILDGSDDYVNLNAHASALAAYTEGTISAWIDTSSATNDQTIFNFGDSGGSSFATLQLTSGGNLRWWVSEAGGTTVDIRSTAVLNDGNWHHVAVTVGPSGTSLWVDGIELTGGAVTHIVGSPASTNFFDDITGSAKAEIGAYELASTVYEEFTGLIDDFRVYDRVLSAGDIAELQSVSNSAPVMDAWFNSAWAMRKELTISSANVASDVSNFPVLIALSTDTQLAAQALANGDDIVFTAADGVTQLAHEIEFFDEATGELRVWVKTDLSGSVDTNIYMYFGNSASGPQQNPSAVWDNYVGVYHLGESPTGAPGELIDSSGSANHATTEGAMDAADSVTARIGQGLAFDGSNDLIRIPDSLSLDSITDEATFSLWINFVETADGDTQLIMASSNRYSDIDGYEWAQQGTGEHFFYPDADLADVNYKQGPDPFTDGTWHHLAATMDFSTKEVNVYVDGTPVSFTYDGVTGNWTSLSDTDDLLFGGNPDRATRFFNGMMDEIRIADVARSQEWIQTEVNNQSAPGTFVSLGVTEDRADKLTDINEDDFTSPGDSVLSILNSSGADRITDDDTGALEGIAVTAVDNANGQWQYDANADGSWLAFAAVSDTDAVLLDTAALIRFVPNADYNGSAGDLIFHAWDQTSGANGDTGVDVSTNGGYTAYSSEAFAASLNVSSVNDDPVITSDGGLATAAVNILENESLATIVTASDPDLDTPVFSITGGVDQLLFSIDAPSGMLTFKTPPDYENPGDVGSNNSYEVEVTVVDGNGGSDSQMITVTVGNEDPIANGAWFDESNGGGGFADFSSLAGAHSAYLGSTEQLIDLESLTPGDVLSNQFVGSHGVTFSNTGVAQSQVYAEDGAWIETITGYDGSYAPDGSNVYLKMANDDPLTPFTIEFATPVAKVGALLGMGKEGINHDLKVRLYDAGGNLIDQHTLTTELWDATTPDQNYESFFAVSYDTAVISKIEILNDSNTSYANALIFDQLTWSVTPEVGDSFTAASAISVITGNVLANDLDPAGGTLSVSGFTQGTNGSVSYNGDGTFTYTSIQGFTGNDTFDYTIIDGSGGSDTATVSIAVSNNAPAITSDGGGATAALNVDENTTAVTTVTATDADTHTPVFSISGGADAKLFTIDANSGALSFKAAADFETPQDAGADNVYEVEVSASDRNGGADLQLISVTVDNVNATASNDAYAVDADQALDVHWWDANWTRRQQISFDNTDQAETLTDFPVLLVLNSGNIDYNQTRDDGSDLRFFAADGTALAFEIEQWNESGDSLVWVKVPQIVGGATTTAITMYYGNASAAPAATESDVWDSDFVGVWHLNEEQGGIGGDGVYKDSTAYSNDGIDRTAATGQDGQAGDGQELGASDWIEIDHDASLDLKDSMTISFWIKQDSNSGTFNRVVEKGLWGYGSSYYFGGGDGTNDLTFYLNNQEVIDTADNVLAVGVWQHAALSYTSNGDGTGTARMYLDGVEIATGNYTGGVVAGNSGRLGIGHDDPGFDFDGSVDEVQISSTDRSADWIAAQYMATRNLSGSEFANFQGEQPVPADAGVLDNDSVEGSAQIQVSSLDITGTLGLVTLNPDGTFDYDPNGQFDYLLDGATASDSFSYDIIEANGATNTATVTITVTGVNEAPTDLHVVGTDSGGLELNKDGGNDVLFVADDGGGLLGGLTAITVEALFSVDTPSVDNTTILSYADGSNDEELAVMLKSDGRIWFLVHSNGSVRQESVGLYPELLDGEVHHLAVSWDSGAGDVELYVDGQAVESFTGYQAGQTITGGGELIFGQDQDSELAGYDTIDIFSGTLYDVRIFNDVRTAGEVAASYQQTLPATEPGMIANWVFGDLSTGGVVTDTVAGNNLTEQHVVGAGFSSSTPQLSLEVAEDAVDNTVIGSIIAVDPDTGDSFTYTLTDNAGGRFAINSLTGELTLADGTLIDYESNSSHNITVRVSDAGALTYDEVFTVYVTNANDAPTGSVTIDNTTPAEGDTLTASNTLADEDGLGAITYTWKADGTTVGTGNAYVLTQAEVGTVITVEASYTDGYGQDEVVASAATSAVTNVNDAPTGAVTIDNTTPAEGDTLSASNTLADEDGLGVITYTWKADGTTVGTGNSYVLTQAEVGTVITVEASYTDGYGANELVVSAATAAVTNVNDAPTGSVTIDNTTPAEGDTLTATNSLADEDGLGAITYTWKADGTTVGTGAIYVLTQAEVGTVITVEASYTDGYGQNEVVASAGTAAVTNVNDSPTGSVTIDNTTPAEGDTLTASNTLADEDGLGAITYTWKADGTTVGTGSAYVLTPAEVGTVITVEASYTDGFGQSETVSSAGTAPVANTNNSPTGSVTIDNTSPAQGDTLTASNTLADLDGMGAIIYTWKSDGTTVGTGGTYVLAQAEVGKVITVEASYTDGYGTDELVASAATAAVTNVNDVPTGSVTISNTTPAEGETLSASNTLGDADGLGVITYTWKADGSTVGTGNAYVLTQAEVGTVITVEASYTDGYGQSETVTSAATAAVTNVNDSPTGSVTIDNTTPTEGDTLTASNSLVDEDGLGAITYTWKANGTTVGTGNAYVLTQAEVGMTIRVEASYTDSYGASEVVASGATAAVANLNNLPTGTVSIDNIAPQQGDTLTASNTLADEDGLGAITYTWKADGTTVGTGNSYVLTQAEVGTVITVEASYSDGYGQSEVVASAATAAVTNVNDAPTGIVSIDNTTPTEGDTLTASDTLADLDGLGVITYTWKADGTTVGTGATYVLTQAEVGKVITVEASYTDGYGMGENVASADTTAVGNANNAPTGSVTIDNTTPAQGDTLTASNTLADEDGLGAITYTWKADGATVGTGDAYVLTQAEVGAVITVEASYIDGYGASEVVASTGTAAVTNTNDAPTGSVTISNTTPAEGETLSASNTLGDDDGMGVITYTWKADGTTVGTGNAYVLTQAEVGTVITVEASYTDGYGQSETVTSAATAAVTNVNDSPTGSVTIDNTTPTEGDTLTASNSLVDEDGLGAITYTWKANGTTVGTGNAYVLTQAEVGMTIRVEASYTDSYGASEVVASGATAAVANLNNLPTGTVSIDNTTPAEGDTLTASNTLADEDGLGAITYTWKADGTTVGSGNAYVLTQAEVGTVITVEASYTDGYGQNEVVVSTGTAAVTNVNDAPTGSVTIDNTTPAEGDTLTASNSLADDDGLGAITYTWKADGTTVGTGATYVLTQAEVGTVITVEASYSDGYGQNEVVASAGTAAVTNVNDSPTGSVSIDNTTPAQGDTLTASNTLADADGLGAITYTWKADGTTVGTGNAYVLTQAEVGAVITVEASYTDGYGANELVASAATAAVTNINDAPTGVVSIDNTTPAQGDTLTASNTLADEDGLGAITYTWKADGATVGTGTAYVLTQAEVGRVITVEASYTDGYGQNEEVASAGTAAVTNVNDSPTGSVTIDNTTPAEGDTLTASNTLADADGLGAITYTWKADGATVGTGASYLLTQPEVGAVITVEASYTDGYGQNEVVASSGTAAVTNFDNPATITGDTSYSGNEGDSPSGDLNATDTDGLTDTTYFSISNQGANGTAAIDADTGAWTYTPTNPDWFGTDSFEVTVTDDLGGTTTQAVSITLANVNDVPTGAVIIDNTTPAQGDTLTAANSLADADGLGTISYTWKADGATVGTGTTYVLTQSEVGKVITVDAGYTDGGGSNETVSSSATAAVVNVNDAPTGVVTIDNTTPAQGDTLTASNTLVDQDGLGAVTYTWKADGVTVGTGGSYVLTQAEVGAVITVEASYTDGYGQNEVVASTATAAVTNVNDAPTGSVTIDNTAPQQGDTLTASNTLADEDGLGAITYTWKADGATVGTGGSYVLTQAEVGRVITVEASYIDAYGASEVVASAGTAAVANVNDAPTGAVTIDNMAPSQGDTLSVNNTLADDDGLGAITYTWKADGAIVGTGSSYVLTQSEVGGVMTVEASYTDGQGTSETVASAGTAPVTDVDDAAIISGDTSYSGNEGDTPAGVLIATDADGLTDASYFSISTQGTNGLASIDAGTGAWTFTPTNPDWFGSDSFEVTITDDLGGTTAQVVSIALASVNDLPTGAVIIDNTAPVEDDILTVSNTLADADGLSGLISYQWYRDGLAIAGETASTYTTVQADVGASISVEASYIDDLGMAESVVSSPTAVVQNLNDAPSGAVIISGSATEDQTLTASNSLADEDGLGAVSYQWQRDGADIAGATSDTYTLDDADVGTAISAVARYTDGYGTDEGPLTSAQTAAVANTNDVPTGQPAITGTVQAGQLLSADTSSISDADGLGAMTLQWQRSADGGQTWELAGEGSQYLLDLADAGAQIRVEAVYTDAQGTLETLSSNAVLFFPAEALPEINSPEIQPQAEPEAEAAVEEDLLEPETEASIDLNDILEPDTTAEPSKTEEISEKQLSGGSRPNPPAESEPEPQTDDTGEGKPVSQASPPPIGLPPEIVKLIEGAPQSQPDLVDLPDTYVLAGGSTANELQMQHMDAVLNSHSMWQEIDKMKRQIDGEELSEEQLVVQYVSTGSVGLVAGMVAYALRGGALAASVLGTMPAWKAFDPLPILVGGKKKKKKDQETLAANDETESVEVMFD